MLVELSTSIGVRLAGSMAPAGREGCESTNLPCVTVSVREGERDGLVSVEVADSGSNSTSLIVLLALCGTGTIGSMSSSVGGADCAGLVVSISSTLESDDTLTVDWSLQEVVARQARSSVSHCGWG